MKLNVKRMSEKEIEKVVGGLDSKSEKMRALFVGGLEINEIKELLGVSYNYVFNVVSRMGMKMGGFEEEGYKVEKKERKGSEEKGLIMKDLESGMKVVDVCKKWKKDYNVVLRYKNELLGK